MKKANSDPRIVICSPRKCSIHKITSIVGDAHFKWAYIGENVINAIAIENFIGVKGERIDIADKLQETAHSLRDLYIDYIGELKIGLPNWWATTISEKNPFISKTFLHVCYLKVCQELLANNRSIPLVIFVENAALRKTIVGNNSNTSDIECIENKLGDFSNRLNEKIKSIAHKTYYIITNILHILIIKYYYKLNKNRYTYLKNRSSVLVRDWIDYRSFDSNGNYHSAYLGKLNSKLKSNGKHVAILPYISNINKKSLKQMVKSNEPFIIPHSFLNVTNVFSKLFTRPPILKCYPTFENLDITYLIKNDFKKDNQRFIDALLYYDIIKNLSGSKSCFESCIFLYENYIDEKLFCMAMKTYYPSTKLIGYQHSSASKMLLSYFFSGKELKNMPFPDKVITNGPYFTNLFKENNYPPDKVFSGAAIRYGYLYDKHHFKYTKNIKSDYTIIVTPSVSINETLELLMKIIQSFGGNPQYKIVIKYHPATNLKTIEKYIKRFPSNVHVSEKSVPDLLKEADLLIYTFTGACIEALCAGVPVLHIKSSYSIDLDMFDYKQNGIYSAKNIDEIIKMGGELLQMDEEQLRLKQAMWNKVVEDMFSPVTDQIYELFECTYD